MYRPYIQCDKCGKDIYYGNAYVSINRNIEQAEYILTAHETEVQVIDSNQIITLCGKCGNAFNTEALQNFIKVVPFTNSNISEN